MPAERTMVCTRPDFDTATLYASYWAGKTLTLLQEAGIIVTDLLGDLANKDSLVEALNNYDPIAYWGVGHGNETQFAGQDAIVMLEKEYDELLFVERIVHLTSCLTGASGGLLESIANAGALATIGYSVELIVGLATENFPDTPENNATKSLLAPDCQIELSLAQGKAVIDALLDSDNVANAEIEFWRTSEHPDADLLIWAHISNRDNKVLYGLGQAEYRTLAEPLHPFNVFVGLATIITAGLVVVRW